MTSELTADQIFNLEAMRIGMKMGLDEILPLIGTFIAIPAMIVLIVWLIVRHRTQRNKIRAELMAKAIESGQTLPENFFDAPKKQRNPLKIGIILVAIGFAISLYFWLSSSLSVTPQLEFARADFDCMEDYLDWKMLATDSKSAIALGIIPFLIGVAFIIIHFLEKKK
jgi:purine-cytosine permease-like protein